MYTFTKLASEDALSTNTATPTIRVPDMLAWTVTKNQPSEAVLASTTSELEAVPTVRIARSTVSNIFSGTGMQRRSQSVSQKGYSFVVQLNDFIVADDTTLDPQRIYLPISTHMVFKHPEATPSGIDLGALLERQALRMLAFLYEGNTSTTMDGRLNSLIRGNLLPTALR